MPAILRLLIEAIRVSGRWVSKALLRRLSARAEAEDAPSRPEIVREFCRLAQWRDAKDGFAISSASVALRHLEKRGEVQLPPAKPRAKPSRPRKLRYDGEPLPPLPKLPAEARRIGGLRMTLIQNDRDPNHWIWNRLIVLEHPLGQAPLVGAQLRYLIQCEQGLIGAFGLGPPAFHLECRDQWIGWSPKAHAENLERVIGLSRFVLRRGLRCSCLASRCYGLILRQVADDWHQRYGSRPVLVETYVDRERYQGRSLAGSNWRRVGESKGRGRDDRQRQRAKSIKDVWIYELDPQAREQLQAHQLEVVAPCSVFSTLAREDWVELEMDGVDLGDQRLNQRARQMLHSRWQRPSNSFYRSFGSWAGGKGAYGLVESKREQINLQSLLAPHQQQTAQRMAAETVVLLAQDTTPLSYNTLQCTEGLGPIGEGHSRGMFLHSLQAFRTDGIPLGTAWAEVWARPEQSDTNQRNQQSIDEKESGRWIRALQAAAERARQMPQTHLIISGDRESDIYELYDQKQALPNNVDVLVRAQHDRCLEGGGRLWDKLACADNRGIMEVNVPRRTERPARVATLEVRWMQLQIKPPAVALKKSWPSLTIYAVMATEIDPPPEEDKPIQWVLITTWPVNSLKDAVRSVRYYALRWGIECWHKVLKVVCKIERRQLKTAMALERALAFDMIVASRVFLLNRLGKEHPDLPAEFFYTPEELEVLRIVKKKLNPTRSPEDPKNFKHQQPRPIS